MILAAWVAAQRRFIAFAVSGSSMEPSFCDGDFILVDVGSGLRPGDPAIFRDPRQPQRELIKRVKAISPDGWLNLAGDNPDASTDSRVFGAIEPALIVGRACVRYWPPKRAGLLRRAR
jgi:nickel-type superoxide dismutase maturation protease